MSRRCAVGPRRTGRLLAWLLGASLAAARVATAADLLSLSAVIEEAREHNPEMQAARHHSGAMAAMPAQAAALDDPTFSYEAWNTPESFRLDEADNNIFRLSQKLPFPGKRRLAGEVAAREADVARHGASDVELQVVDGVRVAFYDLWEAHERLAVYRR